MDIKYQDKIGTVHIAKNDCHNGLHKIGDEVNVIYHKGMNHYVMPYLPVNRIIIVNFLVLLVPLGCLYKLIRP